ncbi:78 kDa glucose-regulated protein [Rutstroemia sp. NJR-2017a BBW]|nr:78 kDa glucose-regulated protein [Rutstroemia sp. NJR-2017a BBW]
MPLSRTLSLSGIAAALALCLALFLQHHESLLPYLSFNPLTPNSLTPNPPSDYSPDRIFNYPTEPPPPILGIHLDHSTSRIGIFQNRTLHLFPDSHNLTAIPAYVSFNEGTTPLVGSAAKEQAEKNSRDTVYDLISIIGRNFSDHRLQDDIKSLPYEIVERNNKPYIRVRGLWRDEFYTPEQVYSFIFQDLKRLAENNVNETVEYVVVTVPTYFDAERREAIKNAAAIAGLYVVRVLTESIATGEAYWSGYDDVGREDPRRWKEECNLVFYHHGEGESYAVVMEYDFGVYDVLAVVKESDIHPDGDSKTEKINTSDKTEESLPDVQNTGQKPLTALTELEDPVVNLLNALLKPAKIEKQTVEGIFITGNRTQVTLLEPKISAYFPDKQVISNPDIHPDEAIVRGASIIANVLAIGPDVCPGLMEMTVVSLGIETAHGAFAKILPRWSVIPNIKRILFSTVRDNQEKVVINIYEGDRAIARGNKFLGMFELANLPRRPKGELDIEVGVEVTPSWGVIVRAKELESGKEAKIVLDTQMHMYTGEELDLLGEEAEERKEEDLRWLENARMEIEHGGEATRFDVQLKD